MLDDELTLLDGTEVISLRAVARRLGRSSPYYAKVDLECAGLRPETVLDGQPYYNADHIAPLVAGRR